MEPIEQRHKTGANLAVSLAACHSFLQHKEQRIIFDPSTPGLRQLWQIQGAALSSATPVTTIEELVKVVSPAWALEVGGGGDVAIMLPSGNVLFYAEGNNQVVIDPMEEDDSENPTMIDRVSVPLRRRLPLLPRVFPVQQDAFDAADMLPFGFLMVWPRDKPSSGARKGSKQYLVAGLDDFWTYYRGVPPVQRNFYEMIRGPCCFHADLECKVEFEENRLLDPMAMVDVIKELVAQQWLEETLIVLDPTRWELTDSCTRNVMDPMSISSGGEEESDGDGKGKGEEPVQEKSFGKVSYHLCHPDLAFYNNHTQLCEFCQRVVARAPPSIYVSDWVWNGKTSEHEKQSVPFMDMSIYTSNRCFRLVYSTKAREVRFLLPLGATDDDGIMQRDVWERNLVSLVRPLSVFLPLLEGEQQEQEQVQRRVGEQQEQKNQLLVALSAEIERHFQPEAMRGYSLDDSGICTFSMINHNCKEICNDEHNNQVYAVADLKRRVFYAKCHADRTKKGPDHPFPATLTGLSLVDGPRELVPGGLSNIWTLRNGSGVLRFCRAVFGSGSGIPARIPEEGEVTYDSMDHQYIIHLGMCETDGGQLQLTLSRSGVVIRCAGATNSQCSRQGWRLERPSRSSSAHGSWDLSFILPTALPEVVEREVERGGGGGNVLSPQEVFLAEPNLFKSLDFVNGAGTTELYTERLKAIEGWAKLRQANAPPDQRNESGVHELAARVQHKASIIRAILLDRANETAYRECLLVAPDFEYPMALLPKGPVLLLVALWVFLAKSKGYKRSLDDFYVPTTSEDGQRFYYTTVPLDQLLTRVCSFEQTPNLCALMWSSRTTGDMERMLRDENHWPSIQPSKRCLGFRNAVYDLEQNVAMTWEDARNDPTVMPFNCLDEDLPLNVLEKARRLCPKVTVQEHGDAGNKKVVFSAIEKDAATGKDIYIDTPLFDQLLTDQCFDQEVRNWKYGLFGRMFHRVGKNDGDNWEICHIALGAPGTGKSSEISVLQSYMQPSQFGVIATKTEKRFPITSLQGKHMVFLTETGGCDMDKELLKQMLSGDPVTVATKFKMAATLSNWDVPVWMAGNRFLDCVDTDGSLERRCGVFPYTRVLSQGQGDVGLVKRIIAEERVVLLIKCNTLYLAMKKAIREPIQLLLPELVQEATRQALMQNDSLRMYLVQQHIVVPGNVSARFPWSEFWNSYLNWCRHSGNRPYSADPHSSEVRTMVSKMGGRFTVHKGAIWLVYIRPRSATDPPFVSAFEVRAILRAGDDGVQANLDWESDEEE